MSCPHSTRPNAGACSQCIADAPVQKVTLVDGCVLVDGLVTHRELVPPTPMQEHARRGGRR